MIRVTFKSGKQEHTVEMLPVDEFGSRRNNIQARVYAEEQLRNWGTELGDKDWTVTVERDDSDDEA